jgi:parallel beta-helix repeat protein
MSLRRRPLLAGLTAAIALALPASASADTCDKVAAPGGSNTAAGTEAAPYATFQKLVDSLAPGQAGCLRGGTYNEENVTVGKGGTGPDARITVRSYPGERAKHVGRVYVTDRANFVTVEQLDLNGSGGPKNCNADGCGLLPSPTVNGDDVVFQDNDVTNDHTSICFNVGNPGWGAARRVTIQRNRIHNCGRMPASNHDHGIYLVETEDVQILDNVIYDNADRGIQLYPNADRTVIRGNILDGNGQGIIFSGVGGETSDDNIAEHNIVTNAKLRYNIESYYPDGTGSGNVARNNCVHGGTRGNISSQDGFTAASNLVADPQYVDRGAKDFRLRATSPCAAILAGAAVPATPAAPTAPTAPQPAGTGSDSDGADQPVGKPGEVILENVSVKRSKRSRRWRLRVAGRLTGWGAEELKIQVRSGSGWKTLGSIHGVRKIFRATVQPPLAKLRKSNRMAVRVVIPGVDASNTVLARARR